MKIKVDALKCKRCGYLWVQKRKMGPRRCPKCWAVTLPTERRRG